MMPEAPVAMPDGGCRARQERHVERRLSRYMFACPVLSSSMRLCLAARRLQSQRVATQPAPGALSVRHLLQGAAAPVAAQLEQGLGLDLADALAGHPEAAADLLKGVRRVVEPGPSATR